MYIYIYTQSPSPVNLQGPSYITRPSDRYVCLFGDRLVILANGQGKRLYIYIYVTCHVLLKLGNLILSTLSRIAETMSTFPTYRLPVWPHQAARCWLWEASQALRWMDEGWIQMMFEEFKDVGYLTILAKNWTYMNNQDYKQEQHSPF